MRISHMIAAAALAAGSTFAFAGASYAASPVIASGTVSGKCIDIRATSNDAILYTCHGGTNQNFVFASGNYGQLKVNGKCLSTSGSTYDQKNKAPLIVTGCNSSQAQKWVNDDKGFLRNEEGWCADVERESRSDGARIIAFKCEEVKLKNGKTLAKVNQRWGFAKFIPKPEFVGIAGGTALGQQANNASTGTVLNGSGLVAAGGGNLVAAGGGNLVGNDGASLVAAGGGNIMVPVSGLVAAGGGN